MDLDFDLALVLYWYPLENVFPLSTVAESVIAVEILANWKAVVSMAVSTKLHCTETEEPQFILVQIRRDMVAIMGKCGGHHTGISCKEFGGYHTEDMVVTI